MITSNQNPTYKHLLKLKKRKYRLEVKEALIYGDDIILSAKQRGLIKMTIGPSDAYDLCMSESLIQSLADYELNIKELAVVHIKETAFKPNINYLVLDRIQDPKNVGALIRSALAFGFDNIFLSTGTADPYHEEAIRAAKGATFSVNFDSGNTYAFLEGLIEHSIPVILTSKDGSHLLTPYKKPVALVLGNEGAGIDPDLFKLKHDILSIETKEVESLNVAVAGGIAMYILRG
jgi:TrmH family RNA methyltransferase